MTDEQTFADYRSRLNIKDVLEDAGYTFYKRDGLRYPAYVRLGSDGKRISGDKYIVMPNKNCCFQPPTIKLYSVTSFIWEHPDLFKEYKYGMKESALVHKVCQRLLNIPVEHRSQDVHNPTVSSKPFDINDYKIDRFNPKDFESQKPFYAFFSQEELISPPVVPSITASSSHRKQQKMAAPIRISPSPCTSLGNQTNV